jgi:adenine-specific DNA-methyltransferase
MWTLFPDPGDLVLDITCGSGTTAFVAEQWGRRWITCDTSRVATALAKQRLMAALFDYYHLAHPDEGVSSGFRYKTAPHLTLAAIANNEAVIEEPLYDRPVSDSSTVRVTGPFTFEAVPAPTVRSLDELEETPVAEHADNSIARSGATLRQDEWMSELLRSGVRGKGGQRIEFTRLEPLPGHA